MPTARTLRLGIDVGGTFTDVVAIDASTRALIARVKVPTTHAAAEGVAAGIIAGIERIFAEAAVRPEEVAFIAHSTTQATNALLEGDVARVGVLGLHGPLGSIARRQMRFPPVRLTADEFFTPKFAFANRNDHRAIRDKIDALVAAGSTSIAVSSPFGVDRPAGELVAVENARARGVFATAGHDVTSMYGLRARTRTAALNAAILPKMVQTARMTASAVAAAAVTAPLMIMRSDGGVMDVREVERRPLLTLLSGPAAGVAGALLYENVSDGIFIEVGGTSSDCSAIRAGAPRMRSARIGGHPTMLRTVDVRTLGVAGGSMLRVNRREIVALGPRSAHIAGCTYACFAEVEDFEGAQVERIAPLEGDAADHAVILTREGKRIALTPTCAANLLGYVPSDAFSHGSADAAGRGFDLLARHIGGTPESLARRVLELASTIVRACVDELIADAQLDRNQVTLIGGGGGAASILPFLAELMHMPYRIARDAEVISPIGVALALVRDVIERTIVNPTAKDIVQIRCEATDRVIAAGAAPDRVEVSVEIDVQRNRVRATASGATALVESMAISSGGEPAQRAAAARALAAEPEALERISMTSVLSGYHFGEDLRIVDERGVVRLALRNARVTRVTAGRVDERLRESMESATNFGDVGRALPELYLLHGGRIADFCGLASIEQAVALAREELAGRNDAEEIVIITIPQRA